MYDARVTIERPLVSDRETAFVASVDRSRRLVVRADAFPGAEERTVANALVLPAELPVERARERARDAVFRRTLRTYSLNYAPQVAFERAVDIHELFWIAEQEGGDVIVDSVRGDEDPLHDYGRLVDRVAPRIAVARVAHPDAVGRGPLSTPGGRATAVFRVVRVSAATSSLNRRYLAERRDDDTIKCRAEYFYMRTFSGG